ncbi:adhesin [Stenotrophomonas sp. HITSZ_GD]|uniref:adhesin n=1 Tax=Stenotrophomonas sp. HITSZ_GD TaxID=3037248 RepID=UPI00240E14C2|nr:adhesin [Stenotrophomonas sp. HITSZ_GD]MDG2524478.1 adhesin [Stenotrophomonas sp. HITSZ_GD]
MNANHKWTVLAMAVSTLVFSAAASATDDQNQSANINHLHNVVESRTHTNTNTNTNTNVNTNVNTNMSLDAQAKLRMDAATKLRYDGTRTDDDTNISYDETRNVDVNEHHNVSGDEKKEKNNHGQDANVERDSRLKTAITLTGDPTVSGDLEIDSAATALIDNRQTVSGNKGINDKLTNDASIGDDVASEGSGNLGFNVAAGDNNAQDNAAALSAADSSFTFGMADAAVFVNQGGADNVTINKGVTNTAGAGDNAFSGATGNIGVNITSGNNNEQKNALSASVATSRVATAAISSNQVSAGNFTKNEGTVEKYTDTTEVTLRGKVQGYTAAVGYGGYEGETSGSTASTGSSYQKGNFYLDTWSGDTHPSGNQTGHIDMDNEIQGAIANPNRQGVGGIAFDNDSEGSYEGTESGDLGFVELGVADLYAQLSGTVKTSRWVVVDATNTASLSGSAFSNASGNIGVNVSAGTGNLQANSLALAVAQPSTGAPPPSGGGE